MNDKLNTLTIKEAREGLKARTFSSVELTKACLARIKAVEPKINAFVTVCEEDALREAKRADDLASQGETLEAKPLLGIPMALKDLFSTKGIRTTAASKVLENYIPQFDATVVKKLKDAGAVVIGKTNHDAWGHGASGENSDFGPTKNPWNQAYVPGGSSSGSGAAVASDMCLAATGTDTGGSSRSPANFCNVVGLKPTYGRVSRYGIIAMASSLDSIGHLTKTVEDSALLLSVTAGSDSLDATTPNIETKEYAKNINNSVKGIKIGVDSEFFSKAIESKTLHQLKEAYNLLKNELGVEMVEVKLPHAKYANPGYYIVQPAEVSSNLARYDGIRYGNERSSFGDEAKRRIMLGTYELSAGYYDAYYKKAMQVRTRIINDFEEAWKSVDVIIAPVSPTPPWKLGEKVNDPQKMYLSDIFTVTANLVGVPSLSIPIGFVDGLPVGMQIVGPRFSEEKLFQIGYAYEQETEWYKRKPVL